MNEESTSDVGIFALSGDSPLDRAIREARRRIEETWVERD